MAKGTVTLPDGRAVGSASKELKEYKAANPDWMPTKEVSFEPPPLANGEPKDISEEKPRVDSKKKKANQDLADDEEDYKQVVGATFAAVAAALGDKIWLFDESEAARVARPLSRIARRNTHVATAISNVADPIALVAAVCFPIAMRYPQYIQNRRVATMQRVKDVPVADVTTQAQPPTSSPTPAYARPDYSDILASISNPG